MPKERNSLIDDEWDEAENGGYHRQEYGECFVVHGTSVGIEGTDGRMLSTPVQIVIDQINGCIHRYHAEEDHGSETTLLEGKPKDRENDEDTYE